MKNKQILILSPILKLTCLFPPVSPRNYFCGPMTFITITNQHDDVPNVMLPVQCHTNDSVADRCNCFETVFVVFKPSLFWISCNILQFVTKYQSMR